MAISFVGLVNLVSAEIRRGALENLLSGRRGCGRGRNEGEIEIPIVVIGWWRDPA